MATKDRDYDFIVDRYSVYGLNRYRNFSTAEQGTKLKIQDMREMATCLLVKVVEVFNPALFVVGTDALYCYRLSMEALVEEGKVCVYEAKGKLDDLWFFKQMDGAYLFDQYTLLIQTGKNEYIIG